MFERGMFLSVFYCLCYIHDMSMNMLDEQVSEERYMDLNEEEDIRMDGTRDDHWRGVADDGENKKNIHALR